jgi:hypothetical protein
MSHVLHDDSSSLILDAKKELQKEKALVASLKNQQAQNSNVVAREGEEGDMDDTEIGQESMSEDDSEDDSDRKGT